MNRILILCCCILLAGMAHAQRNKISTAPRNPVLVQMEAGMRGYANDILQAPEVSDRFRADSAFTRSLVQALKTPYSFSHPFDSLKNISFLYAPDSSFRIITWQIMKDFSYYRHKGAIQMHTNDGSLKLIPLFDYSSFAENPVDSVRDNEHWIGAIYYGIVQKTFNNKKYYTLIGYDENDARSTRKWLEVLTFDATGRPQFGGRFFNYANDDTKPLQPAYRFCLEFKKESNATLRYDDELDMIVMAHLTSDVGDNKATYSLVPYGTFEGFRWLNGKWQHVPVVKEMDPRSTINPQQGPAPKENPEFMPGKKKKGQ